VNAISALTPLAYAPVLSYQAAALYLLEADRVWQTAMGEAPAPGGDR
jgi:hypothetical protein